MLEKLTEHVYYMKGEEKTDRPFLYYIKGKDYSVAIDAGNSKAHVESFYKSIQENGFELPHYTMITHWHWDHTFGIPYIHGKTVGTELTRQKLIEVSKWVWTEEEMNRRQSSGEDIEFCNQCIKEEYKDLSEIVVKTIDIGIIQEMEYDLGDITLKLIPRDSTHSRDSLFIYIPEEKILVIGDADCEDHYENDGKFDRCRLDSMRAFIGSIDFKYALLGHDFPETKESSIKYLNECIGY
ncbi:MAG: MBL fold metallo-hydrolase [Cellulosilyticum sp.]|nr:MBL fold metallo-hydrolase [Cellulosilyticum sp.]